MVCGWWISICFVCFCVSRFVACDHSFDWQKEQKQLLWRQLLNFRDRLFLKSTVLRSPSTYEPHPNACPLFAFMSSGAYFQNRKVHTHDKIKVLWRYLKTTHYFSNKNHIFSSDKENSPGNVTVLVSNMDSFYGTLKQKVGWNIPETIQSAPTLFNIFTYTVSSITSVRTTLGESVCAIFVYLIVCLLPG